MRNQVLIVISVLMITSTVYFSSAYGHSMFNSAEEFYGGYRVQVATAPEFPQIDEPSQFLLRVTDEDFEEVKEFTMGIRIFYNGKQIDAIPPTTLQGGHWEFDYVWKNIGNHIVNIDLYDVDGVETALTYTFNMGTQSPFGIIFIAAITVGAFVFVGIMSYIYLPRILKKVKP